MTISSHPDDLVFLHTEAVFNRHEIAQVEQVGCFSCIRVYAAKDICNWTDDGKTALCPHCKNDAVLAGIIDTAILTAMHKRWFHNPRYGR